MFEDGIKHRKLGHTVDYSSEVLRKAGNPTQILTDAHPRTEPLAALLWFHNGKTKSDIARGGAHAA